MKTQTRILDILATLAARDTATTARIQRSGLDDHTTHILSLEGPPVLDPVIISRAHRARIAADAAAADLAKRPKNRRDQAAQAVTIAEAIALRAARRQGGSYSGDTTHAVRWNTDTSHTTANAHTVTSSGEAYSGKARKYCKTDALHVVRLDPAGIPALVENEALRESSSRDGLPLISLKDDGSAVWLTSSGKQILSQAGWVIGNGTLCYHSTKSREDAQKGFDKKHALHLQQQAEQAERYRSFKASPAFKAERRARLIARLCGSLTATIADARALGYCTPGIESFQREHGVGDTATLPQLIKTGNHSAVSLALHLARKAAKVTA
jgi:type II secretory pathway pseudopilin PulG